MDRCRYSLEKEVKGVCDRLGRGWKLGEIIKNCSFDFEQLGEWGNHQLRQLRPEEVGMSGNNWY